MSTTRAGKPALPPPRPSKQERADSYEEDFEEQQQFYLSRIKKGGPDVLKAKRRYRNFLIKEGRYFFSLEEVLAEVKTSRVTLASIVKKKKNHFKRDTVPDYDPEGGAYGVQEFKKTKTLMDTNDSIANAKSEGHSSRAKKRIWDMDILGRPLETLLESEVAHMIPAAENHAIEWYDVASWAMGLDPSDTTWGEIFRMLHGTKGEDGKRVYGSGIRHFVANKAPIVGQEKVLDKEDPQLLLLPIKTPEECREWNGEYYEAIVLIGRSKKGTLSSQKAAENTLGLRDVENHFVMDATPDDLKVALESLTCCIEAMVQSLVNCDLPKDQKQSTTSEQEKESIDNAKKIVKARLEKFMAAVCNLKNENEEEIIIIPNASNPGPQMEYRAICKIGFSSDSESQYHPQIDPILLLARAAVVWSVRYGFRLRASAIPQDYCNEEDLEEDARQLEHLSRMVRKRQLQQYVEGMELTMEENSERLGSLSHDDTSSISSSGESQDSVKPSAQLHDELSEKVISSFS